MKKGGIMKHLFSPKVYKTIVALLILLLLVKIVWLVISLVWLSSQGIDHVEQKAGKALYYRVKLTPNEIAAPQTPTNRPSRQAGSINDIALLAIYNATDTTVITVKHKSKTKVLSRGDAINGFVVEGAGRNFATFSKNRKTYKVMLLKSKTNSQSSGVAPSRQNTPPQEAKPKEVLGDVTDVGDHKLIDRSLIDHYAKNMDDIYKNIGIGEIKDGNNLKGFKITFVRRGSPFAKLGVRRDDIIKSINGQEINSYNAAFGVYKNIQNIENLTLVIQRGKEEMELEYEIN